MMGKDDYLNDIVKCPMCGKDIRYGDMIWLDGGCTCEDCYKQKREYKEI